jgi:multiple sugar transport system permease protein
VSFNLHPTFVGLENYAQLIGDPYFWNALSTSAIFVSGSVAGQFLFGLVMALLLNKGTRGNDLFRTVFMITMVLSDAVVGFAWYILYSQRGVLNVILQGLNFPPVMWLADPSISILSLTLANAWFGGAFAMIILETGLKSISGDVYESAAIDGASQQQRFRWITLPLIKPFIATCLTTITIFTFNYFGLILIMTGGGPIHSTEVVPLYMWNLAFSFDQYGYGAAVGVFATIVNVIAILAYRGLLRR